MRMIAFLFWTRPEIIKLYPLIKYCLNNDVKFILVHSNQHYSHNLDTVFFEELKIPNPSYNLNIWSWSHAFQTARILDWLDEVFNHVKIDFLFVHGDTNTTLAWWLFASKKWIKLVHIEAWLRSYDRSMPEEINRIIVDSISDYLFTPTKEAKNILLNEWISSGKILVSWNTIVDAIKLALDNIISKEKLTSIFNLNGPFILLTIHRPSNTVSGDFFIKILNYINDFACKKHFQVIFPIHPRTEKLLSEKEKETFPNISFIEPVWFLEMLALEKYSDLIISDSWWIQEEAYILKKKMLVLRNNTERPEVMESWNINLLPPENLVNIEKIFNKLNFNQQKYSNVLGDGSSAKKIFNFLNSSI